MGEKIKKQKNKHIFYYKVLFAKYFGICLILLKKKKAKKKSASSDKGFNPDNKEVIGNLPIVWS